MKSKWRISEQPMGQRRIQVGNLKVPETNECINTTYQNM